jgi:membrane protein YqaA with SNARE-associated domain
VPPDLLQIALSVSHPRRSFFYASVSAVASVLGAIVGWMIGIWFWDTFSSFFFHFVPGFTPEKFEAVGKWYKEGAMVAILLSAFTPIPFKVFTIASGVFGVGLGTLVIASAIGRSARFMGVAATIFFFGPKVKELLDRYFNLATIIVGVLGIGGFVVIKFLH